MLRFYEQLFVAIDGAKQQEQSSFELACSLNDPTKLTVRWAIPEEGVEFNARAHVGTKREFLVQVMSEKTGEHFSFKATVTAFGLNGSHNTEAGIWCTFEAVE